MGFALLDYNAPAAGVNTVNLDFSAVSDPDFSQRNSHYIFTEQYYMLGAAMVGASVIRGRFQVPTWNAIGEYTIFSANRSLQPPSNPQFDSYFPYPAKVPLNEEFQCQVSNNLGAATEQENVLLWLATEDWNANLPRGASNAPPVIQVRFTATITPTINVWSGASAITLSQSLRGGVYAVVGATMQGTNAAAFRIIFPRYRLYHGRKLRPGWFIQNAVGDVLCNQIHPWQLFFGEWGRLTGGRPKTCQIRGTLQCQSRAKQALPWRRRACVETRRQVRHAA